MAELCGWSDGIRTSSSGHGPSTTTMRWNMPRVGVVAPRSHWPTEDWRMPSSSARSAWVRPAWWRAARIWRASPGIEPRPAGRCMPTAPPAARECRVVAASRWRGRGTGDAVDQDDPPAGCGELAEVPQGLVEVVEVVQGIGAQHQIEGPVGVGAHLTQIPLLVGDIGQTAARHRQPEQHNPNRRRTNVNKTDRL